MIGYESWLLKEGHGRRMPAMVAACVASLLLHILLAYSLSEMTFQIVTWARKTPDRARPMHLADIKPPKTPESVVPLVRHPGDPSLPADLTQKADVLGVPPDEVILEPPAVPEDRLAGQLGVIAEPSAVPERVAWEPRQEILAVENQVVADREGALGRQKIPRLDRVMNAPDFVFPADREEAKTDASASARVLQYLPESLSRLDVVTVGQGGGDGWGRREQPAPVQDIGGAAVTNLAREALTNMPEEAIENIKAIEKYLTAELTTYEPLTDLTYGYFRIEIKRLGEEALPVIPKDVLLVQDCSASMTDVRLYFCTNGLTRSLGEIGPRDRFNVVTFRETSEWCFPQWVDNTAANRAEADRFIGRIRSSGNTDIYASLKDLLKVNPDPGRPVIALLMSDGHPTAGMVRSTDIIGEFTKANEGRISVFSMGTIQTANSYLLDLVSYCNRGESSIIRSGRWDIPERIQGLAREVSRPVLSDVRFFFVGKASEVYPVLTSNLYHDRPLVLHGRYRKGTPNVVFQAVGNAGAVRCDMVFDLSITKAKSGDKDIRTAWAKTKIYSLIGNYARQMDPALLTEIQSTARQYRIDVPYSGRFDR